MAVVVGEEASEPEASEAAQECMRWVPEVALTSLLPELLRGSRCHNSVRLTASDR